MNKPKVTKIVSWLSAIFLAVSFIPAGIAKLNLTQSMILRFENWGYDKEFALLIGLLELLGGLLVLWPKFSFYGAILIGTIMIGAVYTHLSTEIGSPLFACIYFMLAFLLGMLRYKETYRLSNTPLSNEDNLS